jgi:P-type E1-E2 ATPase
MLNLEIPGFGSIAAEYLVMDLNGTLGLEGVPDDGVIRRLRMLSQDLKLIVVTADTHGRARELPADFGMKVKKLNPGNEDVQKRRFVQKLGREKTITIGNGSNDVPMLGEAAVGICVIGEEGAASAAMMNADVVVHHIHHALDLLIKPKRLLATLRR